MTGKDFDHRQVFREVLHDEGVLLWLTTIPAVTASFNWGRVNIPPQDVEKGESFFEAQSRHEVGHRVVPYAPSTVERGMVAKGVVNEEGIQDAHSFLNVVWDLMVDGRNLLRRPDIYTDYMEEYTRQYLSSPDPRMKLLGELGNLLLGRESRDKTAKELYRLLFNDGRSFYARLKEMARLLQPLFTQEEEKEHGAYGSSPQPLQPGESEGDQGGEAQDQQQEEDQGGESESDQGGVQAQEETEGEQEGEPGGGESPREEPPESARGDESQESGEQGEQRGEDSRREPGGEPEGDTEEGSGELSGEEQGQQQGEDQGEGSPGSEPGEEKPPEEQGSADSDEGRAGGETESDEAEGEEKDSGKGESQPGEAGEDESAGTSEGEESGESGGGESDSAEEAGPRDSQGNSASSSGGRDSTGGEPTQPIHEQGDTQQPGPLTLANLGNPVIVPDLESEEIDLAELARELEQAGLDVEAVAGEVKREQLARIQKRLKLMDTFVEVTDRIGNRPSTSEVPETWRVGDDPAKLDLTDTLQRHGMVIPGVTTVKKGEGDLTGSGKAGAVMLILDVSGSTTKPYRRPTIDTIREAAFCVAETARRSGDSLGAVAFSTDIVWTHEMTTTDHDRVIDSIVDMRPHFHTNVETAAAWAHEQIRDLPYGVTTFLVTDGQIHDIKPAMPELEELNRLGRLVVFIIAQMDAGGNLPPQPQQLLDRGFTVYMIEAGKEFSEEALEELEVGK